jgi:uncharacterized protein YjbI with pentapeptide repeats
MANGEHLALLKQGVDTWNRWKANNPDIRPNLSFATGKGIIIRGAKLSGVDLSRADLSRADLSRADLVGANLSEANFSEAYLSNADLIGADLSNADLSNADLIGANLIGTNLSGAKLNGVDLSKANLRGTDLSSAKLIGAKLSGANLSGAKLSGANLSGAHLSGANFKGADLSMANLSMANLTGALLQKVKAFNTNFNKATLTGVCLEDWQINSATNLNDVACEYLYLTSDKTERCPPQNNFDSGEFTQLFQKQLETVDLIFNYGIDWQAFLIAFNKLKLEINNSELAIQAIENRSNSILIIKLNVPFETKKIKIENELKQEYDAQLKTIDNQYRYQFQAKYEQIATYRQQSADLNEIMQVMAKCSIRLDSPLDDLTLIDVPQSDSEPATTTLPTHYSLQQKQNLIDTVTKIHQLLQQLEQAYPITTPLEKQQVVIEVIKRIEKKPALKAWVIGVMKEVSVETLKKLITHPLVNVLLAALEEYKNVDQ